MAEKKKGTPKRKNRKVTEPNKFYDQGKLKKKTCPKCGAGVFMAEHGNRSSCGKCGYCEFKKKE